ncbi:hypothetical protein RAA17_08370 [Komagataeibacter rhaeticus]|nr:hypothetical protein [Komagataeibacter rhaeticus]
MTLLAATAWLGLFSWRDDMRPMPPLWKLGHNAPRACWWHGAAWRRQGTA